MALEEQCARIRAKATTARCHYHAGALRRLFDAGKERRLLGVSEHGLRPPLRPPLSEAQVSELEKRHAISLPSEYRAFLSKVGSSGTGPYYGLLAPSHWPETDIQQPCLLRENLGQNWLAELYGPDWEERLNRDEIMVFGGTLPLCHQGCGIYSLLVLNGPHRGRICNVEDWTTRPIFSPHRHFLDWYEGWLNEILAGKPIRWYGYPNNETSN